MQISILAKIYDLYTCKIIKQARAPFFIQDLLPNNNSIYHKSFSFYSWMVSSIPM